jgi:hypothetical protein
VNHAKCPLEKITSFGKEGFRYSRQKPLPPDHLTAHSHNCLGHVTPAVIIGRSESATGAGSYHRTVLEWHRGRLITLNSPRVALGQVENIEQS